MLRVYMKKIIGFIAGAFLVTSLCQKYPQFMTCLGLSLGVILMLVVGVLICNIPGFLAFRRERHASEKK